MNTPQLAEISCPTLDRNAAFLGPCVEEGQTGPQVHVTFDWAERFGATTWERGPVRLEMAEHVYSRDMAFVDRLTNAVEGASLARHRHARWKVEEVRPGAEVVMSTTGNLAAAARMLARARLLREEAGAVTCSASGKLLQYAFHSADVQGDFQLAVAKRGGFVEQKPVFAAFLHPTALALYLNGDEATIAHASAVFALGTTVWSIRTPSKSDTLCVSTEARAREVWAQMVAAATTDLMDGAALLARTGFRPPLEIPLPLEYNLGQDGKLVSPRGSEDAIVERWLRASRAHYSLGVCFRKRARNRGEEVLRHAIFATSEGLRACRDRATALWGRDSSIGLEVDVVLMWIRDSAPQPPRDDAATADEFIKKLEADIPQSSE